jgi:hypothetical protein
MSQEMGLRWADIPGPNTTTVNLVSSIQMPNTLLVRERTFEDHRDRVCESYRDSPPRDPSFMEKRTIAASAGP